MESINRSEMIAYRSSILQALEELKLRRAEVLERKNAADKLLAEKFTAEQHLESASERLKHAEMTISTLRGKLNDSSAKALESRYREENLQLKVALEAAENTVAALKKEIGMISIQRHQLEASLKQSEQRAASHDARVNGLTERMQCVEKAAEKLSKQLNDYEQTQALLQKNLDSSLSANKNLVKSQAYAECVIKESRKETEALKLKLIGAEARCRWSQDTSHVTKNEEMLQDEIEQLKQAIEILRKNSQDDKNTNEKLSSDLKAIQKRLDKCYKIIASSTADDVSVIEMEKKLRESQDKSRIMEEELHSIKEKIQALTSEKEQEVTDAHDQITKLKNELQNFKNVEADLKHRSHEFKEAKLSIQELKMLLNTATEENQNQAEEMEKKRNIIERYETELRKLKQALPTTVSCGCQTESEEKPLLNQGSQTDCIVSANHEQSLCRKDSTVNLVQVENAAYKVSTPESLENNEHGIPKVPKRGETAAPGASELAVVIAVNDSITSFGNNATVLVPSHLSTSQQATPDHVVSTTSKRKTFEKNDLSLNGNKTTEENTLAVDLSNLHGEDIVMSSSQEEVGTNSTHENHANIIRSDKAIHAEKGAGNDPDMSCSFVRSIRQDDICVVGPNAPTSNSAKAIRQIFPLQKEKHVPRLQQKMPSRKRRLADSPPMLDLSQSSVAEEDSLDRTTKQIPLLALKNFTKQVLADKPITKPRPRFEPLNIIPGPSGSFNICSKSVNNKSAKGLYHFSNAYFDLKQKLSREKEKGNSGNSKCTDFEVTES